MSLIKCPVCNSHISELESNCPNCEFQLTEEIIQQIKTDQEKERAIHSRFKNSYSGIGL